MSDSLPAIGVITAPAIKYDVKIQDDDPYETSKSLIRVGMAGINIVSAYITIVARQLRMISTFHGCDTVSRLL